MYETSMNEIPQSSPGDAARESETAEQSGSGPTAAETAEAHQHLAALLAVQAHGFLPDMVAFDDRISAETLILLALRTTVVNYSLGIEGLNITVAGGGLNRDVVKRANAEAKRVGYLQRSQPTAFSYAREKLTLPEANKRQSQIVWRGWFRGALTRNELASLFFMRAKRKAVRRSDLAARFRWSLPTATAALRGLMSMELVTLRLGRHGAHLYRIIPQVPKELGGAAERPGVKNRVRRDVKNRVYTGDKNHVRIRTPSGKLQPNQMFTSFTSGISSQSSRESQLRGRASENFLGGRGLEELRQELELVDGARALAPSLLTRSGLEAYVRMLREPWAANLHAVLREKLCGYMLGGLPEGKGMGFIDGWGYFAGAAEDRQKAAWLADQGLRPGDIHGVRQKPLTAQRDAEEPVMPPEAPPHDTIVDAPDSDIEGMVDVELRVDTKAMSKETQQ